MELVSKHVKVVLDGQGADEQLGGYHNFFGSYYKDNVDFETALFDSVSAKMNKLEIV